MIEEGKAGAKMHMHRVRQERHERVRPIYAELAEVHLNVAVDIG